MSLLVLDVISRAARLLGGLASGSTLGSDEAADGLVAYNSMKRAMFGTIIGPRLSVQPGVATQAENGGLYTGPAGPGVIKAPANPRSGWRFGVNNACTISPNGTVIAGGSPNYVTTGPQNFWYRGDIGAWLIEADGMSVTEGIEFPDELVDYLPFMLAPVISSEFGSDLTPEIVAGNAEGRQAFARLYGRRGRASQLPPLGLGPAAAPGGAG